MPDITSIKAAIIRAGTASLKTEAVSIPLASYNSPELYGIEVDLLFRPNWLPLGRVDQVATPGSYYALDIVGEPLVMTRDEAGEIHVFSRLCPHRGMEIVEGCGKAKTFLCPYHSWSFDLSGACQGAPFMDDSEGFDLADHGLRPVRFEIWNGFVFVNLDGKAEPLAPQIAPLNEKLAYASMSDMVITDTMDFGELEIDWKILLENSVECYHHCGTHLKSLQRLYPAQLSFAETDTENFFITYSVAKSEGKPDDLPPDSIHRSSRLVTIFPYTRLAVRPDAVRQLQILPLAAGRSRLLAHTLLPREIAEGPTAAAETESRRSMTKIILDEDIDMCQRMQKMSSSKSVSVGRLSQLEEPVWNFYRYLAEKLAA